MHSDFTLESFQYQNCVMDDLLAFLCQHAMYRDLLDYFSRGLTMKMLFTYSEALSFLIRLVSKLLHSDARSCSNHILKQDTVTTLCCFPFK